MFSRLRATAVFVTGVMGASVMALGVPLAANAAGTATLSGVISLSEGVSVEDAHLAVYVYSTGDEETPVYFEENIGADGSYSITDIEAGDYKVFFSTWGSTLASEWSADAADFADADVLTFGDGATETVNATLERGASISGTVSGGGVSLGYGWVIAYRHEADGTWNEGYANIAEDGTYSLVGLRPGTYSILFSDLGGYGGDLDGEFFTGWQEWWDDALDFTTATRVTVDKQAELTTYDVDIDSVDGEYTWPEIFGTLRAGATLTASTGPWPAGTVFKYRWYADGVEIRGATKSTLVLAGAQYGKSIEVGVFGLKPDELTFQSKFSGQVGPVGIGTLVTRTPTIAGALAVGSTVTAKPGAWTAGTAFTYRWYANGVAIKGATKATLKLGTAQKGKKISVRVSGTQRGFTSAAKTSATTGKVTTAATPRISGTAKVGRKLTAVRGTWASGTRFSYQWKANGVAIKGATKSTFTLKATQKGKKITVTVTGKKSGYATVAKTSKSTATVRR